MSLSSYHCWIIIFYIFSDFSKLEHRQERRHKQEIFSLQSERDSAKTNCSRAKRERESLLSEVSSLKRKQDELVSSERHLQNTNKELSSTLARVREERDGYKRSVRLLRQEVTSSY